MTNIIPFEHDDVTTSIKDKWREKGYDVDSETSNASILTELMAYAINIVDTNMSFGLSDITLKSSEQRKNILALARQIGYEASLRKSYQYKIYLRPIQQPIETLTFGHYPSITIAKFSEFTSGDLKFYYVGDELTYTFYPEDFDSNGVFLGEDIEIVVKEGTVERYKDNPLLNFKIGTVLNENGVFVEESYIDIPYKNVENDGVFVYVTPINDQGNELSQEWTKRTKLIVEQGESFASNTEFLQLRNIDTETIRVYFNFAGIGNFLLENTVVEVDLLISSGAAGLPSGPITDTTASITNNFTLVVDKQSDIPFITGSNEENNEDIKTNAPMFFNSGNRLVTGLDYRTFLESNSLVKNAFIWGGEDELIKQLGNVWFSLLSANIPKTFENVGGTSFTFNRESLEEGKKMYLLSEDINGIKKNLDELKIITIQLNDRQPVFIDFYYEVEIAKYNSINKQYVHDEMFGIIKSYFFDKLEQYDVSYYNSTLIKKMDVTAGDNAGFDYNFVTKTKLYQEQIRTELLEDGNYGDRIVMNLALNEQKIYGLSNINVDVLPNISSDNFKDGKPLFVDFENPITNIDKTNQLISFDIYLDKLIVGRYNFVNTIKDKSIRIEIYIDGTLLTVNDFNTPREATIDFKYKNFTFIKNTVPRLAGVTFI